MKKLLAFTAATLTAATMTTSAIAADDQNVTGDLRDARAGYEAISTQVEMMGYEVEQVNFNEPMTMGQKVEAYEERSEHLQDVFNDLHSAN